MRTGAQDDACTRGHTVGDPTITPTVTPTAAPVSSTPIAATTVTEQGNQDNAKAQAAATNAQTSNGIHLKLPGGYELNVNGPIWFSLLVFGVFILIFVFMLLLARRAREKINKAWSMSTTKWIILLLLSGAVLLTVGVFLRSRIGSVLLSAATTTVPTSPPLPRPTESPSPGPTVTPTPIPATPFPLSVSSLRVPANDQVAEFGGTIIVTITNLKEELAREIAQHVEQIEPRKYVLFLDDIEIKKLYPVAFDPDQGALTFRLDHTPESKGVWSELLARQEGPIRSVKASVGPEGKLPISSDQAFTLRIYRPAWLYLAVIVSLIAVVLFLWLARRTNILRDSEPLEPPLGMLRPYSLARSQAAWWLMIVFGSFVFLWVVTGDFAGVTNSSIVLIGIATGTVLVARIIDASKHKSTDNILLIGKPRQATLAEAVEQLKARVSDIEAKRNATQGDLSQSDLDALSVAKQELANKKAELEQVDKQVADATTTLTKPVSEGFITDILTDVNGITLYRFQMVVWMIVLGVIFGLSVWRRLSMPELSDSLLTLTGISAGAYIGFKIPERQTVA